MALVCQHQIATVFAAKRVIGVIKLDPWLEPFRDPLKSRFAHAQKWIKTINETEGGLEKFSRGREKFGFNVQPNGDISYCEWAPNAKQAFLTGDFSGSAILIATLLG
jgi:1,4-alpha-glucan branching enzyme